MGENTWQTDRCSPFGPKFVNHHDALNSFHLESIPNLQGVKTRLRWRTTLWGSKSETARVPAGAKWGAKGGFGVGHPPEGLALSTSLRFFFLGRNFTQKIPSHQAKRSESLQCTAVFFWGGKGFLKYPDAHFGLFLSELHANRIAWLMKNPQDVLLLHPKMSGGKVGLEFVIVSENSWDFVVSRG